MGTSPTSPRTTARPLPHRRHTAVVAMRKQLQNSKDDDDGDDDESGVVSSSDSWYRPLERLLLPWTRLRDGLYVDSNLVSAVQNFDASTMRNKNGVFGLFGSDFFQTTVEGPFSWDGDCRSTRNDDDDGRADGDVPTKRRRN